ncbi:MAG: 2-phosphosulfolactate phosphatase [Thermosipho sp. (in: Bacteria)]|nr:2-phosphosulfolactate phosphatase [Thermosipho sp. (in: thermotogales)]
MIEVLFTYREKPAITGTSVVVDILRAGSVVITALGNGAQLVKTVKSIKEAKILKKEGYIICGERNTVKISGFDKGNSPLEFFDVAGKKIVLTTSNGTKTIEKARKYSKKVMIGAFLNFEYLYDYIKDEENIIIWCSGNNGKISYEDTLFAGMLVHKLVQYGRYDLLDSVLISLEFFKGNNLEFKGSHVEKLIKNGFEDDISFCKKLSIFNIIPQMIGDSFYGVKMC